MAPFRNSEVIPMSEVPGAGAIDKESNQEDTENPVVLVVDDEPLVADTLATILNRAGYKAVAAYGGERALELARATNPALVISDFAMPNMNGVELAMAVLKKAPDCGILLFSGHATVKDLTPAREAGYNFTLLTKPLHPDEMLKHVSRNLCSSLRAKAAHLCHAIAPGLMAETA